MHGAPGKGCIPMSGLHRRELSAFYKNVSGSFLAENAATNFVPKAA